MTEEEKKAAAEKAAADKAAAEKSAADKATADKAEGDLVATLQAENESLKAQLKDAHDTIEASEEKIIEAPVLTIDKKKYRLTIPRGVYPTGKYKTREVTAAVLKKDKKFAELMVKIGYGGLELVNPKD